MKIDKDALKLGISGIATLALYALSSIMNGKCEKKRKPAKFKIDENTQWILECLDDMVIDIRQILKDQEEQGNRLAQLEARIDNVNSRVDSVVGGK